MTTQLTPLQRIRSETPVVEFQLRAGGTYANANNVIEATFTHDLHEGDRWIWRVTKLGELGAGEFDRLALDNTADARMFVTIDGETHTLTRIRGIERAGFGDYAETPIYTWTGISDISALGYLAVAKADLDDDLFYGLKIDEGFDAIGELEKLGYAVRRKSAATLGTNVGDYELIRLFGLPTGTALVNPYSVEYELGTLTPKINNQKIYPAPNIIANVSITYADANQEIVNENARLTILVGDGGTEMITHVVDGNFATRSHAITRGNRQIRTLINRIVAFSVKPTALIPSQSGAPKYPHEAQLGTILFLMRPNGTRRSERLILTKVEATWRNAMRTYECVYNGYQINPQSLSLFE